MSEQEIIQLISDSEWTELLSILQKAKDPNFEQQSLFKNCAID